MFIVFVEVGVLVHVHTGQKKIRGVRKFTWLFSNFTEKNVRVNIPKIVVNGLGRGVGKGVDENTFRHVSKNK
jgi:hypothetical protein